ncbi:hypothetical protein GO491_03110 [Flavobacteriaceae bacterium Ap0902]|nr:hypothetical protein [Flavobacteriaceae bacterium Ap0902]
MIRDFSFKPDSRGLKSVGVNIAFRFGMQTAKPFEAVKDTDIEFAVPSDFENTPWLTSLEIKIGKDKTFIFPEVIITISQERNIVTTPLQGRDGTIKEYISDGDYNITLDAAVMDYTTNTDKEDNEWVQVAKKKYPKAELERLREIILAKKDIEVQSSFLQIFNITTAVVKSFTLQQETHSNRQSIQIQMLSDMPYEIKQIKEDYVKVK